MTSLRPSPPSALHVHHAVLVGRDEFAPFHLPDLPSRRRDRFFSREETQRQSLSLGVVKRSDNIPVHEKPKMPWEIDSLSWRRRWWRSESDQYHVRHRAPCGNPSPQPGFAWRSAWRAGLHAPRRRVEFHAGIIDQSGDQFICQLGLILMSSNSDARFLLGPQ